MLETNADNQPSTQAVDPSLRAAVEKAVLAVPGVLRLEPSLLGRLGKTVNSTMTGCLCSAVRAWRSMPWAPDS